MQGGLPHTNSNRPEGSHRGRNQQTDDAQALRGSHQNGLDVQTPRATAASASDTESSDTERGSAVNEVRKYVPRLPAE